MHTVCASEKLFTGNTGAAAIPAIRIRSHNVSAGIRA